MTAKAKDEAAKELEELTVDKMAQDRAKGTDWKKEAERRLGLLKAIQEKRRKHQVKDLAYSLEMGEHWSWLWYCVVRVWKQEWLPYVREHAPWGLSTVTEDRRLHGAQTKLKAWAEKQKREWPGGFTRAECLRYLREQDGNKPRGPQAGQPAKKGKKPRLTSVAKDAHRLKTQEKAELLRELWDDEGVQDQVTEIVQRIEHDRQAVEIEQMPPDERILDSWDAMEDEEQRQALVAELLDKPGVAEHARHLLLAGEDEGSPELTARLKQLKPVKDGPRWHVLLSIEGTMPAIQGWKPSDLEKNLPSKDIALMLAQMPFEVVGLDVTEANDATVLQGRRNED